MNSYSMLMHLAFILGGVCAVVALFLELAPLVRTPKKKAK